MARKRGAQRPRHTPCGTKVQLYASFLNCVCPSTHTVARLKHNHGESGILRRARRRQAGHPRADHCVWQVARTVSSCAYSCFCSLHYHVGICSGHLVLRLHCAYQ